MNVMISNNKSLFKKTCIVLVTVFSLIVLHRIYLDRMCDTFEVQIDFVSDGRDIFSIYSPDEKGGYSKNRLAQVRYGTGEQTLRFLMVLKNPGQPLRIDPGFKKNNLVIQGISFTRFGIVAKMDAEQINSCITQNVGVRHQVTEDGLQLLFGKDDPQLILEGYPFPAGGVQRGYTYFVVLLLSSLFLSALISISSSNRVVGGVLKFTVAILLLGTVGWYLSWSLALILFFFFFFLCALIRVLMTLSEHGISGLKTVSYPALFVIVCFLVLVLLPFYKAVYPEAKFVSKAGNEVAALFEDENPTFSSTLIRKCFHLFEDNFISNFPYGKELINLNATIKIFYLGFTPNSKSILGKEGMFFEGYGKRRVEADIVGSFDNITDYMGLIPFTTAELDAWLLCIEERYYWMKELGIDYVFVLAPTKALIYPENLPSRILKLKTKLNRETRFEQLVNYLKEKSVVPVVDLRTELLKAKDNLKKNAENEGLLLYYRTDFHWNYLGSFLAYQAIIDEVNRAYPKYQYTASQLGDFTIDRRTDWVHINFINGLGLNPKDHTNETYLTLYPKSGSIYNQIGEFGDKGISDYSSPKKIMKDYGGEKVLLRELDNDSVKTPMILLVGDSFSGKYFGYFTKHAKKTIRFRSVYTFQPEIYVEAKPDLVIQEILNLYLLEKPPRNPESIKGARVRALSGVNDSTVSVTNRSAPTQ